MNYSERIWRAALHDAEQEVLRSCSIPNGGRRENEPVEMLVDRVREAQDRALEKVYIARRELRAALAARSGEKE